MNTKRFYIERGLRGAKQVDSGEGLPLVERKKLYDSMLANPVSDDLIFQAYFESNRPQGRQLERIKDAFRRTYRTYPENRDQYIKILKAELMKTGMSDTLAESIMMNTHPWYMEGKIIKITEWMQEFLRGKT